MAQLGMLAVDLGAGATATHIGMYMEGKVEYRGSVGQLEEVALRGEHKHVVLVEVHLELVHQLYAVIVCVLQCLAYACEPLVEPRLALHALVSPVGGKASLGNLVHALGAYLHLHPFTLGTHHRGVERLVAVALRYGEPVAQALGVGLIHVGHDGVGRPALLLLLLILRVQDDAYGKEVVDALEVGLLLLHLLADGVDALRTSLDVVLEPGSSQFLVYRVNERGDILVAGCLGGIELLLDVVVHVVLRVLEREVLQLRLQLVQAQLMRQRSIQVGRLVGHLQASLVVVAVLDLAHRVHAVGNHDKDYAHVLGKGEQQVAEVLRLDGRVLLIQACRAHQSAQDTRHIIAKLPCHLFGRDESHLHDIVEQYAHDGCTAHAHLIGYDDSRLQVIDDGVEPEAVALEASLAYGVGKQCAYAQHVLIAQALSGQLSQLLHERSSLQLLFRCEEGGIYRIVHHVIFILMVWY